MDVQLAMDSDPIDGSLDRLVLKGYKSTKHLELELRPINLLIGANGAGKSNFINLFKFLAKILDSQLQISVGKAGGPDELLHYGRKNTPEMLCEFYFGNNGYKFALQATEDNRLIFSNECLWWNMQGDRNNSSGHFETEIENKRTSRIYNFVVPFIRNWRVYHFHDTSESAKMKQYHNIHDNEYFRDDASNLAAFLYRLRNNNPSSYKRIVKTIRLVAPFFGDFNLRPSPNNKDKIQLEWNEEHHDEPFTASHLSDGTLRFICLATVLLQPEEYKPKSILIDEPELGLHPYAIKVLGSLIKQATTESQLILSTQSVELVNEFEANDIIAVDREDGSSVFKRIDADKLNEWIGEYSLGELWKKEHAPSNERFMD